MGLMNERVVHFLTAQVQVRSGKGLIIVNKGGTTVRLDLKENI